MLSAIFFWLTLSVLVGCLAAARERSGIGWFLLSVILSPIIAVVVLIVVPNKRQERLAQERHEELLRAVNPQAAAAVTEPTTFAKKLELRAGHVVALAMIGGFFLLFAIHQL